MSGLVRLWHPLFCRCAVFLSLAACKPAFLPRSLWSFSPATLPFSWHHPHQLHRPPLLYFLDPPPPQASTLCPFAALFQQLFFFPSFFGGNFCSKATGKIDSAFGVGDREEEEEEQEEEEEEEEEVLNVVVQYFTSGKIWPLGLDDRLLLTTLLFDLPLLLDLLLFLLLLWESFSFWLSVFFAKSEILLCCRICGWSMVLSVRRTIIMQVYVQFIVLILCCFLHLLIVFFQSCSISKSSRFLFLSSSSPSCGSFFRFGIF
jgi:hypothetical protein